MTGTATASETATIVLDKDTDTDNDTDTVVLDEATDTAVLDMEDFNSDEFEVASDEVRQPKKVNRGLRKAFRLALHGLGVLAAGVMFAITGLVTAFLSVAASAFTLTSKGEVGLGSTVMTNIGGWLFAVGGFVFAVGVVIILISIIKAIVAGIRN